MENTEKVYSKDKISDGTQTDPHVNSDEVDVNSDDVNVEEIKDIFNKMVGNKNFKFEINNKITHKTK